MKWLERHKQEYFKRKLLQERKEYEDLLETFNEGGLNSSLRDSISELSTYDNHPADVGEESFERSKDLALRDNATIQLEKIDDALKRIENNTYGICENCNKPIDIQRLEAIPETTLCSKCRDKFEKGGDDYDYSGPIEQDVLKQPFGDFVDNNVKDDFIGFDGEDSWQAVARYGTSNSPSDIGSVLDYENTYINWDEDRSSTEDVDAIPYERGDEDDGLLFQSEVKDTDGPGRI
ncbi:MAG: hypothetical protein PWP31_1425 [Clostridia bacterium]|nr:hypothetical protein [Clostridia bacterium]